MKRPSSSFLFTLTLCTLIAAAGVVGAAWSLNRFMLKVQRTTENAVTVKGVATKEVRSDIGVFTCSIRCRAKSIAEGYKTINAMSAKLDTKLTELGFTAAEIEDRSINYSQYNKTIRTRENGRETTREEFSHFGFNYYCRIRSAKVELIEAASLKLYALAAEGWEITVGTPEYFIGNPELYKLELVDAASRAACQRAAGVAESCGSHLGALLTARQGVIQITRPGDGSSSDGGYYDTRSINKVIRMVVTMTFALR